MVYPHSSGVGSVTCLRALGHDGPHELVEPQAELLAAKEQRLAELVALQVKVASEILDALTAEQRLEVLGRFCGDCGWPQPDGRRCQCWNDE